MLNKIYKTFLPIAVMALPFISYAQLTETGKLFGSLEGIVSGILIPLAFTLALLFFFWGVAKYIWSEGQGKDDGRKIMVWGVVALFVMSSIWGIVYFLRGELLGTTGNNDIQIPGVKYGNGGGSGGGNDNDIQ